MGNFKQNAHFPHPLKTVGIVFPSQFGGRRERGGPLLGGGKRDATLTALSGNLGIAWTAIQQVLHGWHQSPSHFTT